MAQSAANVVAGLLTGIFIAPWGSGGSAFSPSYVETGHTEVIEWTPNYENLDIESEESLGIIKTIPTKDGHTIKIPALETRGDLLAIALRQPSGRLSGTYPNQTLIVGDSAEQYHNVKLVVPGIGTTAARTITFWKCQVSALGAMQFGRKQAQKFDITLRALRDDTEAGAGKYGRQVDA